MTDSIAILVQVDFKLFRQCHRPCTASTAHRQVAAQQPVTVTVQAVTVPASGGPADPVQAHRHANSPVSARQFEQAVAPAHPLACPDPVVTPPVSHLNSGSVVTV